MYADPFGLCPKDAGGDGKTEGFADCPEGSSGYYAQRDANGQGGVGNDLKGAVAACKESTACGVVAAVGAVVSGTIAVRAGLAVAEAVATRAVAVAAVGATIHGAQRLADPSRLNLSQARDVIANAASRFTQSDGARVFVQGVGQRYNAVVQNPETGNIITTFKTISFNALYNLSRNYGWY